MNTLDAGIASLLTWARVARGMIGVFLLVMLALIVIHAVLLVAELSSDMSMGIGAYNPLLASALVASNALISVFFLAAAIPIVGWVYRAHANLHEAGVEELGYSPGWSVGSFFVPLVNFVVPFRAMRQLHNRSLGEGPWQADAAVNDVTSWWSCHIAALVVSTVAVLVALVATVPGLYVIQPPGVNTGLVLFSMLLLSGSAAFLFRTIGAVTGAQQRMEHLNHAEVFG